MRATILCVCVCVSPFQLLNKLTDFHEICYECYANTTTITLLLPTTTTAATNTTTTTTTTTNNNIYNYKQQRSFWLK
jgi:hypothetical protein